MDRKITLRSLQKEDYKDFISVLSNLTNTGDFSESDFLDRLNLITKKNDYHIIVAVCDNKVVGTGTLFLEYKFIHNCSIKAHIEDVVVSKDFQGYGIGKMIVSELAVMAKDLGCYKIVLCAAKENVPFYEKCGFTEKEKEMVIYNNK